MLGFEPLSEAAMRIQIVSDKPKQELPPLTPREQALVAKHNRIIELGRNPERVAYLKRAGGAARYPELFWAPGEGAEAYRIMAEHTPTTRFRDTEWWDSIQFFIFIGILIAIGLIWQLING